MTWTICSVHKNWMLTFCANFTKPNFATIWSGISNGMTRRSNSGSKFSTLRANFRTGFCRHTSPSRVCFELGTEPEAVHSETIAKMAGQITSLAS
jgi:hypothetical protein